MIHSSQTTHHALRMIGIGAGAALLALLTCSQAASSQTLKSSIAAREFRFTRIDVPDASFTSANGINAAGDIVGAYTRAPAGRHGFVLRKGKITTIDFPGAVMTEARAINARGDVVGYYRLQGESDSVFHGFLRDRHGRYRKLDFGGHNSGAMGILDDGTILGCRHDGADMMATMRAVVFRRKSRAEVDIVGSMHTGATPKLRRIVGMYSNMKANNRMEGYVIDDGAFKPVLVPGSMMTMAFGVNPAGTAVGAYQDAMGLHGFLLVGNQYSTIDAPNARSTRVLGINDRNELVGNFVLAGKTHGFRATRRSD